LKVLITKPSGGAYLYIVKAFRNAFKDIGCEAELWDGDHKVFNDFDPDLYIGCSAYRHELPDDYRGPKIYHVNPYGTILNPLHGIDINERQDTIEWVLSQEPDAVFGYGHQQDGETYWSEWTKTHGIPFVGVACAGDAVEYYPDKTKVDYKIAYLGGRWGYKGHNINSWLVPPLDEFKDVVSVKGWGGWQDKKYYHGVIPVNESGRQFLSSALVCPCICEPHTSVYGIDIPERFFKVALCESLPILDKVNGFDRYMDNYVMAESIRQYRDFIHDYTFIKHDDRIELSKVIRSEVLQKHTYHSRMMNVCKCLNYYDVVEKFEDRISELVSKN
jgi:hypothetical protein